MKSLDLALAQRRADIVRQQKRFKEMGKLIKATKLGKAFAKLLQYEPQAELMVYEYSVYIDVPVKSMQHMTDALEFFENELGVEFTSTNDEPASGVRQFDIGWQSAEKLGFWLYVRALISGNEDDPTATCKRVQTGVKMVEQPVYEIQCAEQLAVA
jgi:hypothetical protein